MVRQYNATVWLLNINKNANLPDANTLMNSTESFEYKQPSVFNEILQTGDQEEIIHQYLFRG